MNDFPLKIMTWVNNSTTVNIYDILTKKLESFIVYATIPNLAEGAMVADKLYATGGYGPQKSTYEIDATKR